MKRKNKLKIIYELEKQCINCANYNRKSCYVFKDGIESIIGTSWLNKYDKCTAFSTKEHVETIKNIVDEYKEAKNSDF